MTSSIRRAVLLLTLFALGACAEPRWLPLPGSQIKTLMFGATARGTDVGGGAWVMWIAPEGKAMFRGSNADGSALTDSGIARIDGDQLCVDWQKKDQPFCQVIYDDRGGNRYRAYSPELTLNSHFTVVPGNADNL